MMPVCGNYNERILWGGNVSIGFSTSRVLQKSWNHESKTSDFKNFEAWVMWKINTHISDLTVFTLLKIAKVAKIEGKIQVVGKIIVHTLQSVGNIIVHTL